MEFLEVLQVLLCVFCLKIGDKGYKISSLILISKQYVIVFLLSCIKNNKS